VSGISISGTDAANYTFNTTATTTADITPRALLVTATGVNKTYDGTTATTVTLSDNRVSGDVFTDSYTTANFNNKNAGTGKAVSVSGISIGGTDAGNYTFNTTASTTADITARALTITAHGVNKNYDGTTAATVTLSDDRVSGDVLTDSYTSASFADKYVGTGKAVSVSGISISGTDAGNYTFNTTASTTANITLANGSMYVLSSNLAGALSVSGNASLSVAGPVVVNSTSSSALSATGNAYLSAPSFNVVGGVQQTGNAVVSGSVWHSAAAGDPYGGLNPSPTGTTYTAVSLSSGSLPIYPGIYPSIEVSGNGKLTMNPGVYYIQSGGIKVSGNGCITGNGVTIVNLGMGAVNFSGNGTFSLTPSTIAPLAGILICQPAANAKAVSISGNAVFATGTIYAPSAQVNVSGNGTVSQTIVAGQVRLSGNAGLNLQTGGTVSSSVDGAINQGQIRTGLVWVSADGSITTDERARIADAVSMLENTFGPYGLNIVLVDPNTPGEDIRVHDSNTTPVGGQAQGILGYSDPSGDTYIVNNWTWYTGSDPSGISSTQYDYLTVISHELGHAIGLEHSPDSGSVMYATLNSGVTRRGFTAYDLSNLVAGGLSSGDTDHHLRAGDARAGEPAFAAGPVESTGDPVAQGELALPNQDGPKSSAGNSILLLVTGNASIEGISATADVSASSRPGLARPAFRFVEPALQSGIVVSQGSASLPLMAARATVSATDEVFRSLVNGRAASQPAFNQAQGNGQYLVQSGSTTLSRGEAVLQALLPYEAQVDNELPTQQDFQSSEFGSESDQVLDGVSDVQDVALEALFACWATGMTLARPAEVSGEGRWPLRRELRRRLVGDGRKPV
jgi:hypothetical protein